MTMRAVVWAAVLLAVPIAHSQDLPEELQHLEGVSNSPGELVAAARRFQLQQQALIRWDADLMQRYNTSGQPLLARSKETDIGRRVQLIGMAWQYVLQRAPGSASANNYYGEYLYDYVGDVNGGVKYWRTALGHNTKHAGAHNNLGIHYFEHGDYSMGIHHLKEALDLDPKNPDYLFNMAQMYLNHFPQLEKLLKKSREKLYKEAMGFSKDAADYAPEDYDILQDYAVNFYAAENFGLEADWEASARAWQRARPYARTQAESFYTLLNEARAWLRAEKPATARPLLLEAQQMRPGSNSVEVLLTRTQGVEQ